MLEGRRVVFTSKLAVTLAGAQLGFSKLIAPFPLAGELRE